MARTFQPMAKQLPLDAELQEELVLAKARELYAMSAFLSSKYSSFARLMADPVAAKCMRLCAAQIVMLRGSRRTRG